MHIIILQLRYGFPFEFKFVFFVAAFMKIRMQYTQCISKKESIFQGKTGKFIAAPYAAPQFHPP